MTDSAKLEHIIYLVHKYEKEIHNIYDIHAMANAAGIYDVNESERMLSTIDKISSVYITRIKALIEGNTPDTKLKEKL